MLRLTTERIAAVYECLRSFPPFSRWSLPPSADVAFEVHSTRAYKGRYCHEHRNPDKHYIAVSVGCVGKWETLVVTVAHEMVHLRQAITRTDSGGEHNAEFYELAALVCRRFGWDPKAF